jgi:hypothetical protein
MMRIFSGKFEWVFKYRAESKVNDSNAAHGGNLPSITEVAAKSALLEFGHFHSSRAFARR